MKGRATVKVGERIPSVRELVLFHYGHSNYVEGFDCLGFKALIEEGDRICVPQVMLREFDMN